MSKVLGDFLEEQQEPFALQVYLIERGVKKKKKKKTTTRQLVSPNCSAFLKAMLRQFGRNALNFKGTQQNTRRSSVTNTSTSLFDSDDIYRNAMSRGSLNAQSLQDGGERKMKGRDDEDRKQLSPVSVLDDQDSPIHCMLHKGESSKKQRLKEVVGSNTPRFDEYYSVKMQQRKQLLMDCLRQVMENVDKNERQELKKLDSMHGGIHLLHSHFEDEWNPDFQHHKTQISNAIFEDLINEFVTLF